MDANALQAMLEAAETPEQIAAVELAVAIHTGQTVGTLAEVATLFGVGESTLWLWRRAAEPMPGFEGNWNIQAIHDWRERRKAAKGGDSDQSNQRIALEVDSLRSTVETKELLYRNLARDSVSVKAALAANQKLEAEVIEMLAPISDLLTALAPPQAASETRHAATNQVDLITRHVRSQFSFLKATLDGSNKRR